MRYELEELILGRALAHALESLAQLPHVDGARRIFVEPVERQPRLVHLKVAQRRQGTLGTGESVHGPALPGFIMGRTLPAHSSAVGSMILKQADDLCGD